MGPVAHQLLGLFSALTYTYLDTTNPSERIVTRTVGNQQLYPVLREYLSDCPNCDCSGNESNPECVWGCRDCKWQCNAADSNDCRYNCGKCGWDCTILETEWIDAETVNPTVTPATPSKNKTVTLHSLPNFQGDHVDLDLDNIGDCVEFGNPKNPASQDLMAFNDRGQSISLPDGVCVRLYENDCEWKDKGKTLDVNPESPWATRFHLAGMDGVSSVQRIECPPSSEFTIYTGKHFTEKSAALYALKKVGDCQELHSDLTEFNDNTLSMRVNRNTVTCLRLYEHGCSNLHGRKFDVIPHNNYVLTDLSINSFSGIISAVEIIECPVDSPVLLYSQPQFQGNSIDLQLYNTGDCAELWDFGRPITDRMKAFNDLGQSIRLPGGVCVRLYEHDCAWKYRGKTIEVKPNSPWASRFSLAGMNGIVTAVKRIECPASDEFTLHSRKDYTGKSAVLKDLKKVGDCQEFNSHLTEFNDNTLSIRVNRNTVTCLRLYQNGCTDNSVRTLDVTLNNSYVLSDLSLSSFSHIISAVRLINCP